MTDDDLGPMRGLAFALILLASTATALAAWFLRGVWLR